MDTQQDDVNDYVKEIKEEIEEDIMIENNEVPDYIENYKNQSYTGPTIEAKRLTLLVCTILIIVVLILAFIFS